MGLPLRQYWGLLAHYLAVRRPRVLLLAALILGDVGLQLLGPLVLRRFIDAAGAGTALGVLTLIALRYIGVGVARQVAAVAETSAAEEIGGPTTSSCCATAGSRMRGASTYCWPAAPRCAGCGQLNPTPTATTTGAGGARNTGSTDTPGGPMP